MAKRKEGSLFVKGCEGWNTYTVHDMYNNLSLSFSLYVYSLTNGHNSTCDFPWAQGHPKQFSLTGELTICLHQAAKTGSHLKNRNGLIYSIGSYWFWSLPAVCCLPNPPEPTISAMASPRAQPRDLKLSIALRQWLFAAPLHKGRRGLTARDRLMGWIRLRNPKHTPSYP